MDVTQKIAAQAQFATRRILREQGRAFRGLNTMTRRLQVGTTRTLIHTLQLRGVIFLFTH